MSKAVPSARWTARLPLLYAITLFASAALLFLVQPLAARLVLPVLGGSPAVWNTCMLVFQALLLGGYLYAHAAPAWLGDRRQALVHLGVLALPWLVLPIVLQVGPPPPAGSILAMVLWLVVALLVMVGLPFFAVATTGPLLQRWFAATGHPRGRDPYFLYAASNLGSILGLLAYPFLLERLLPLGGQGWAWAAGYALFTLLAASCAAALWWSPGPAHHEPVKSRSAPPLSWRRRGRWLVLAFVPSSLMLSVTLHLSMDVAPIPLLWVVPLGLYLLTFVIAFARRPWASAAALGRGMPLVVLVIVLVMLSEATEPVLLLLSLHLAVLFWIGLFCHCTLAEDRPPAEQLTQFYLWLSLGGVLGGLFNALLAPLIFPGLVEYPLALVLACAVRPAVGTAPPDLARQQRLDVLLPLGLGVVTVLLVLGAQAAGVPSGPLSLVVMFLVPLGACYTFLWRPLRFALGVAVLLIAGAFYNGVYGPVVYRTRSFFGTHRVTIDPTGTFHRLVHGNTVHGQQFIAKDRQREPLTYYHRTGPVGKLITALNERQKLQQVGVIGLGAGALCCYAEQGQDWTFYEIDPGVIDIARNPRLFTYWSDCLARGVHLELVPGDARLTLQASTERYDLLVVDAFSSDAIPVHLLTREALAVYRAHLRPGGLLAFNVSNRYLNLATVLGDLAASADPPMSCGAKQDRDLDDNDRRNGKSPSELVVLAEEPEMLLTSPGWSRVRRSGRRPWSDDFSNLLDVLRSE
jgi:hypothetical protein